MSRARCPNWGVRIMAETNITDEHKEMFEAITSAKYSNFALFSCFVNGTPTAAICAVNGVDGDYQLTPLFVAVTEDMELEDHGGVKSSHVADC